MYFQHYIFNIDKNVDKKIFKFCNRKRIVPNSEKYVQRQKCVWTQNVVKSCIAPVEKRAV